jgi:hypothetical protein
LGSSILAPYKNQSKDDMLSPLMYLDGLNRSTRGWEHRGKILDVKLMSILKEYMSSTEQLSVNKREYPLYASQPNLEEKLR